MHVRVSAVVTLSQELFAACVSGNMITVLAPFTSQMWALLVQVSEAPQEVSRVSYRCILAAHVMHLFYIASLFAFDSRKFNRGICFSIKFTSIPRYLTSCRARASL